MKALALALAMSFGAIAAPAISSAAPAWNITKTQWTEADERGYSKFIETLGESRCNTVNGCLQSPSNPYRGTDPRDANFWADCGRLPYLLRAYYASKNGLPFSIVSGVAAVDGGGGRDIKYSTKGNYVISRKDIVQKSENRPLDAYETVRAVAKSVFTAMYRYNSDLDQANGLFFDMYPAKIDRKEIRPGTVIYDAAGHVVIVYKVSNDGRVHFFDSHPDQTISRSVYGEKFLRSNPSSGAGFKNFRPLYLTGASRASNGNYIGGKVTTIPMSQIPGHSTEYFYGTHPSPDRNWKKAVFTHNGQNLPFYDWARARLAVGDLKYEPVTEMLNMMETLCSDLKDRVHSVDTAIAAGIQNKPQPWSLPDNIYGTSGEWEEYSSPSRDARLRTSFVELKTEVEKMVNLYRQGSNRIVYNGTDLVRDLRENYERAGANCIITYRRTDGSNVRLTFQHINERLWNLSFDPYQCVERRWGATSPRELETCRDDRTKEAWFDAEQRLRNQIDRTYDVKMNFTLDQLRARVRGSGVDTPPDADLRRYLYEN